MIELTDEDRLYGENEKSEWEIAKLGKTTLILYSAFLKGLPFEQVMGLLVTLHAVVGIVAVAVATGKLAA